MRQIAKKADFRSIPASVIASGDLYLLDAKMVDRFWQLMYIVAYRLAKCWWWMRRPMGRGSYVAVWVDDRLLIIRNSYKRSFCVPAGGVDRGETYLQAAVRELQEESGIVAAPEDLRFIKAYTNFNEHKHDVSELFELRLNSLPEVTIDNREVVFAEFMTLQEALNLPLVPVVEEYLRTISAEAPTLRPSSATDSPAVEPSRDC